MIVSSSRKFKPRLLDPSHRSYLHVILLPKPSAKLQTTLANSSCTRMLSLLSSLKDASWTYELQTNHTSSTSSIFQSQHPRWLLHSSAILAPSPPTKSCANYVTKSVICKGLSISTQTPCSITLASSKSHDYSKHWWSKLDYGLWCIPLHHLYSIELVHP